MNNKLLLIALAILLSSCYNVDFVLNPDLVSNSIETAVISGLLYFKNNVTYSQLTKNPITVKYTTKKVKGSSGTWDTRKDLFEIILNHLK